MPSQERLAPWTAETDRILLLAIIATTGSPSLPTIASFTGYSLNSVKWRFRILKKEANSLSLKSQASEGKSSPPASRKRGHPVSVPSSPTKKRKITPKSRRRRNVIFHDTSEEEEPQTPILSESEEEQTPSLRDDDEEEDQASTSSSVEPVTPTKVQPRRRAKPAPGYYRALVQESESEFEDGEIDDSQI
ncbi:hypothetical protein TWF730_005404 [Orbilia blumenaviensis]|uniref:Uncharacterized protein n=1 Tax=Orbilia blumenaviensis TaxID=1796055 RepID=A0AAV9VIA0_9PEZI